MRISDWSADVCSSDLASDERDVLNCPTVNLAEICADHPATDVALISRGKQTTYGELREQAGRLRGGLVAAGIPPGDRVARQSDVGGKRVAVGLDRGGRRCIKKNN